MARPGHLFLQKLAKIGPGTYGLYTDGEGLEEALDDAAYEYLTAEGSERYPDGCRKRCIRKKAGRWGNVLSKESDETWYKESKSGRVPTALLMPGLVCHSHLNSMTEESVAPSLKVYHI